MKFNSSDAWLLQSIIMAEGDTGATLSNVIATADYINHAIMTFAEFQTGVIKLMTIGVIAEEERKLVTTAVFRHWWNAKFHGRKKYGIMKIMNEIERYLNETYATVELNAITCRCTFSKSDFDRSVKDYQREE